MPMVDDVFVCKLCGAEAIESWPYVHCYKCGNREDRPDLGLDADSQPIQTQGAVFGGGTPDESVAMNVPTSQGDQPPETVPSDAPPPEEVPPTDPGNVL